LPRPLEHQRAVLLSAARFGVLACGRRWGKSTVGISALVEGRGPTGREFKGALDGANTWLVCPTYAMAAERWRELKDSLRDAWTDKSEVERRIELPGGGAVTVRSGDDADSLRGSGLDAVVLDECAFMREDVWQEAIRPALSDRNGWCLFASTPDGQANWFFKLWTQAREAAGWERWQEPTSRNPLVPAAELAAARQEIGSFAFSQEYEAQFTAPEGSLLRREWLKFYDRTEGDVYVLGERERVGLVDLRTRFGVVDLAVSLKTTADRTCALAIGLTPEGRLVVLDALWDRIEVPSLRPKLKAFVARWGLAVLHVEATAFQLSLVQDLRRDGLACRELRPDKDKASRFSAAVAWAEGEKLWLPRVSPWTDAAVNELTSFPAAQHDDFADAVAYAVGAAREIASFDFPTAPNWKPARDPLEGYLVADAWRGYALNPPPKGDLP
jgi:predicted phage terminase large subunit-like protein